MTKEEINTQIKDQIRVGLNLCKNTLGVDGSAVIPSLVGKIYEERGTCGTCMHLDKNSTKGIGVCWGTPSGPNIVTQEEQEWWYCAGYEKGEWND